ncbi:MAG: cation-transporting P-type ATPase [Chthoniobacterales bacterium]
MLPNLQPSPLPRTTTKPKGNSIRVSPILAALARLEVREVLVKLKTSENGLTQANVEERLLEHGPNFVAAEKRRGWLWRLFTATRNLLVILLLVLATISFATGDFRAGTVMMLMVILGVGLRFVQESRADAAAAKLKAMISVTATVMRDGKEEEIQLRELVPGDIVQLCAGRHDPG